MHMGGVKIFYLNSDDYSYKLPRELFEAKSFIELSLDNCHFEDKVDEVMFRHLKVLKLFDVSFAEEIFQKIFSSCPLIEDLKLERCCGLRTIDLNNLQNLKKFYFLYDQDPSLTPSIQMQSVTANIESITIGDYGRWFQMYKFKGFPNLKFLSMMWSVCLSGISFYNFTTYFPTLQTFILNGCSGNEVIQISSRSIQHFSVSSVEQPLKFVIDFPNIRSFEYSGNIPTVLSFAKTNGDWKSDINLEIRELDSSPSLWLKINEMLTELSQSEISLKFFGLPAKPCGGIVLHSKPVEVNKLELFVCQKSLALSNLFSVCRPGIVDVCDRNYEDETRVWKRRATEVRDVVCKILKEIRESGAENQEVEQLIREMEISFSFDYAKCEWRKLYVRDNNWRRYKEYRRLIRFQLKWTSSTLHSLDE